MNYKIEKLKKIFEFLERNREYNKEFQIKEYKKTLYGKNTALEKLEALFYNIINTQSGNNFDNRGKFFKYFYENFVNNFDENCEKIKFLDFLNYLNTYKKGEWANKNTNTYKRLFYILQKRDGWGEKTSALFVKAIYHIHNEDYLGKEFHIFSDFPVGNFGNDEFFLPVDEVIIQIFQKIFGERKEFKDINNILKNEIKDYSMGRQMEIWDDLWFWGYFTQNSKSKDSEGNERSFEWNENKYYVSEFSNKKEIGVIRLLAEEFKDLIIK